MRYLEFRKQLGPFSIFSLSDARMVDRDFDRRRLHEWQAKGYIKMISNGFYLFTDIRMDESVLSLIANKIYSPSYVSLETVLSQAGMIPETVHQVTSVSTRRTRTIPTDLGIFSYRSLAPRLFFGYEIGKNGARIACIEKAVLDFLYLHPDLRSSRDYESLRMDRSEIKMGFSREKFDVLLQHFKVQMLDKRAKTFAKWVQDA